MQYKIVETINPIGRYIYPNEFRWLMSYFRDRYDPRRLCLALMIVTGLRTENTVNIRLKDFIESFREVRVPECKAHVSRKKDLTIMDIKWRWMPLPSWLSTDLQNYINHRLSIGYYATIEPDKRLFPCLRKHQLRQLFHKLRIRYGNEQPWLLDIWKRYTFFKKPGIPVKTINWHRISCHGMKAFFCTAAYEICNKDIIATQQLTMHSELKNLQKYVKAFGMVENKQKLKERVFEPLEGIAAIPLPKEQKNLKSYIEV